ncbi:phage tail protein [Ruegeria sp. Ofav3-42]|uniref:phage tail-collar fiber domain-containing protein n=1 Tax=Ruegeria sp. Ofav3-42 TaxID=2917759 RepID=UPI001EF5E2EC|nr:phage tail protein [Ruegeria sp. Ofav3-42]MCG7518846.1 phage tail protein [Ruegeria sp. Ofav3-42]
MAHKALITNIGRNKEAAALAQQEALEITHIAWGDGDRVPGGGETALLNEQGRKPVQASGTVDGALNTAFFEILLETTEGPFIIREAGLFDKDGDLIAIARYDPPVNQVKDATSSLIRIHVLFSDLQNLVLQVQGTDAYVPNERKIIAGTGLQGGGDLGQDRTLAVAFATEAEAQAGAKPDKVISPLTLAKARQSLIQAVYPIGKRLTTYHDLPDVPAEVIALELDRSAVSRASYPDLWAKVQASGRYDATGASTAAYGPGDGATTFDLIDARATVDRVLDGGRGIDVGRSLTEEQGDAIRNIVGHIGTDNGWMFRGSDTTGPFWFDPASGTPTALENSTQAGGPTYGWVDFDASRVVPTASENRMRNIAVKRFIVADYNFGA